MLNRWKSDIYREIEMVHKRTKCHNSSYKNKETIKNTLQKQKAYKYPCNVLNEKQKVEFRKYGRDMKELLNIFNTRTAVTSLCMHLLSAIVVQALYFMLMKYI